MNEAPVSTHFLSLAGQLSFADDLPRVEENSVQNTVVGTIRAFDSDVNQTLSFRLDDDAVGRFGLSSSVSCSRVNDTNVSLIT